jgi:hypothetical protein
MNHPRGVWAWVRFPRPFAPELIPRIGAVNTSFHGDVSRPHNRNSPLQAGADSLKNDRMIHKRDYQKQTREPNLAIHPPIITSPPPMIFRNSIHQYSKHTLTA